MNIFSDPIKIVEQLEFFPGQHLADLGSGNGNYTFACAEKLKGDSNSRIFAVDVQKNLLERILKESQEKKLDSVRIIWGDIEEELGSRLNHDSIDFVLITNTLFQVKHKKGLLNEAKRIVKKGGLIALVDWSDSFGNIGPHPEEVISEQTARLLCEEVGLVFERKINTGEHHYGFIVRKI